MRLKVSSAKWRPFCIGLNVLNHVAPRPPWWEGCDLVLGCRKAHMVPVTNLPILFRVARVCACCLIYSEHSKRTISLFDTSRNWMILGSVLYLCVTLVWLWIAQWHMGVISNRTETSCPPLIWSGFEPSPEQADSNIYQQAWCFTHCMGFRENTSCGTLMRLLGYTLGCGTGQLPQLPYSWPFGRMSLKKPIPSIHPPWELTIFEWLATGMYRWDYPYDMYKCSLLKLA